MKRLLAIAVMLSCILLMATPSTAQGGSSAGSGGSGGMSCSGTVSASCLVDHAPSPEKELRQSVPGGNRNDVCCCRRYHWPGQLFLRASQGLLSASGCCL